MIALKYLELNVKDVANPLNTSIFSAYIYIY